MDDLAKTSLVGRTLAHYRIHTIIGTGGMGEVYRATDTKLGRDIALKVLPPDMASDPDRLARFQREARAVAALNHPNVVTVYSVEESDNVHFITMELIEGQPLDQLISTDGLPVDRIVEIASALAEALAVAHEKGILHRDLKPANVMVTNEGRVKVLDFGLAKDVSAETSNDATLSWAGRTKAGMVMGTPAYMSPEQVSGRALDHRTDIFSLGVMLYEMATGQRPFGGTSSAELISSILRDTPPSVSDARPELPSDLARVIRRCLEKDPRYRMQTARDVSNEFRELARTTIRPAPPSTSPVRATVAADSGAARAEEGFWVAVLPFKYSGANADLMALAEGLSEEVITGLSRFSYLRVIARSSTARYAGQSMDVRSAGKELNARYVMEGTLRQAGSRLRLAVQLVDTVSGAHLWAENYERAFSPEAVFELHDDLVPRIVSTIADMNGALPRSMSQAVHGRDPEQLTPYEAVLRSFCYLERATPEDLAAARSGLEAVVRKAPDYADAWAMLSFLCGQDYAQGFDLQANALEIATSAARRAVELGQSNHLAYFSLAQAQFFQKEVQSFRNTAERAVALNSMDGNTLAFLGEMMVYAGEQERGMEWARRAKQLNPSHPGWYWFADFYNAYRQGDDRGALHSALNVHLPGHYATHAAVAAAYGQLGEKEAATKAVRELLKLRPNFSNTVRKDLEKWWTPEYVERFIDGLRKAGLEILEAGAVLTPEVSTLAAGRREQRDSGATRAHEGFWVAVLPFKCAGASAEIKALADGFAEEIVAGLSRFSYLRVITSGSTKRYADQSPDLRVVGKELGARYVMTGNLRQAGARLRVAVQLADATTGAQLWSETYERPFNAEAIFELQDELVPRIVSTAADMHGVLPRSMSAAVRFKPSDQLTPYEALLRGFGLSAGFSTDNIAEVQTCLERAVQQSPGNADCLAMLATVQCDAYGVCHQVAADTLEGALRAAQTAVEAAPTNALAYHALARVLFFKRNVPAFRAAAERAISLNPMDGATTAYMGILMAFAGDWERGCALTEKGMQLNANHPGWHCMTAWHEAYRRKDYPKALELALNLNAPKNPWVQRSLTVSYAQLGRSAEARSSLRDLLALVPNYARVAREMHSRWLEPDLVEHMMDGLRKAGLEVPEAGAAPTPQISPSPAGPREKSDFGATRPDEGFWVAVLPFKYSGSNADLTALAEGLTDDIITNMSKFSYLRVIARGSTAQYAQRAVDVRTAANELGARYVMEGSIRQAGAKVRIAVQLVDASAGASLWADTYDRAFNPEAMLDLLDDVVPRIVATVGDAQGILAHSMTEALRNRDPQSLTPYEALLRSFGFHQHVSAEEHLAGITALEHAVKQAPDRADCWAMLSWLYRAEYTHGYNARPDSMDRSLAAARRAVNLAPSNQLAQASLASAFFFRRELGAFRSAAERALALNRMEGYTTAFLGLHFAYSGDWERGCALCEGATQLNPNHPGWYWLPLAINAYHQRDGERALEYALKVNMPGLWTAQVALAVVNSQCGQMEQARIALRGLLAIRPGFAATAREQLGMWWQPEMVEQMLGDLRKAGLAAPEAPVAPLPSSRVAPVQTASGEARAAEGFWVAVLPFKYRGANAELTALADGLTDEIVTGLSRFSYLRVIARGSTAKYSSESGDVRAIGKELGARYVMEGSIRQAGSTARVAVQLVDAAAGTHLWAETFERAFHPEAIFSLQDELVPRIVSTVADQHGILPRSILAAIRKKGDAQVSPYEAIFRVFGMHERMTAPEHAAVRDLLERAVKEAPNEGDCWAMLATLYSDEDWFGFNTRPEPLGRAAAAAQRAVELAPASALASMALAQSLFMRREWQAFRPVAERTITLNPMDGAIAAIMGILLACSGDWDRGCAVADSAIRLNPNFPGWYRLATIFNAYRRRDYRAAVDAALRIQMPEYFWTYIALAAAYGQLGEMKAAQKALRELLAIRPDFATAARRELEKWFEPELVEHFLEGLRKAGLEIRENGKPAADSTACSAPSIAVLPFANLSADPEQDYFSDGLAEEIINLLAQMAGLRVIARTSSFAFRGKQQDVRKIADALNVAHILEGSVRRSGSRIRVTAQLIAAADGSHLWSERYDRELSDIFAVQDEISAAIAKALRVKLSRDAAPQRYTPKLEAYETYLKARHLQAKVTPESLEMARRCYEQASALDPTFGMVHVGLGYYWVCLAHFGRHSVHECVPAARAEAQRALQIDPSLADAHALLGYVAAMYDMDWAAAEKHFDFPMAKQASFETIRPMYAGFQFLRGNVEQAIKLAQRAIEEDPLEVWAHMNLHAYLQAAGRDDEALEQLKKVLELDQNQVVALVSMAMIHADKGDLAEALKIARRAYAIGPWFPDTIGVLAALLQRNGEEVESKSLAKELGSGAALGDARAHALFHLLCGEIDQGADWVVKAIEQRDPSMMFYLRFVVCKGLRASHRWAKIAKMINLSA